MPYTKKLYLTRVYKDFEGDTIFPSINYDEWKVINKSDIKINEKDNLNYDFIDLQKLSTE